MSILESFRKKFYSSFDGAAVIISEVNRFYLTGVDTSDGLVLITPTQSYFIVDFRYYEVAKKEALDFSVVLSNSGFFATAKELCDREGIKALSFEDDYITIRESKRIEKVFCDFSINYLGDLLLKMRAIKTSSEIKKIRSAQEITDKAFSHILDFIKNGITENDIAIELDSYMRKCGAQETAFRTICVSGKKSSLPHGVPSDVILTPNSFITMDFGAKLDGYCSDMTRTVVLGKADEEMKRIYNIVLRAQESAIKSIKAGERGCDVDFAARDIINYEGYSHCFGHSTGHGLGIEIHESPSFSPNYKEIINENSILSVEPGIYVEDKYGVRIEDIVVVGAEKAINLTKSTKNLIEI